MACPLNLHTKTNNNSLEQNDKGNRPALFYPISSIVFSSQRAKHMIKIALCLEREII